MSLSELAHTRGVTNRTMHNHIHQLKANGYLTIHYRPGKSSIYHLVNPTAGSGRPLEQRYHRITGLLQRLGPQRSSTDDNRTSTDQPDASLALNRSQPPLIGRVDILATLQENATKRQHTLLVGPLGIGKSHILRHFATQLEQGRRGDKETRGQEPALSLSKGDSATEGRPHLVTPSPPHLVYLDHVSPIKPALLTLAQRLHADGSLAVAGIEANYMEWEDVRKKIAPLRVNQLADLVVKCVADRNYVLILDHLERVTPTMLPHLDALMDVTVVTAATDELKPSAQRLWWAFERVEVPPLPHDQARELLWQVADRDRVAHPQLFETHVLQQAGGTAPASATSP